MTLTISKDFFFDKNFLSEILSSNITTKARYSTLIATPIIVDIYDKRLLDIVKKKDNPNLELEDGLQKLGY